jgi:hypothetical protein
VERPNPHVRRTGSSPSALRSPLTRRPLHASCLRKRSRLIWSFSMSTTRAKPNVSLRQKLGTTFCVISGIVI